MQDKEKYKRASRLVVKHYWEETRRNWNCAVPAFMMPAIGTILIFYVPAFLLAKIVEIGSSHGLDDPRISQYVLIFGLSWLTGEALWRIGIHYGIKLEVSANRELYRKGLSQLLARDVAFFNDNFAGSLTKRTLAYANRYVDTFDTVLFNIAPNVIPTIFAAIILSFYSVWLGAALIGSLLVTLLVAIPLIKKRRKLVVVRETASTVVSGHVADVYGNIAAIRAHSSENREQQRHMLLVDDLMRKVKHSWDYQNRRVDMAISPLYVGSNVLGLLVALHFAREGSISIASLIIVYAYFAQVTRFMWEFNGIYRRLETALSDAAQYTELLLEEPSILDPKQPKRLHNPRGEITFANVDFSYDDGVQNVFKDLSLHIPAGQKVGLVGHSGGGKTSITKLLLRFSDIQNGSVQIDGCDIKDLKQYDLRQLIAYVPQDPAMFHRSITENIAYGKPDASSEEIKSVAKKAHAHEFIKDLPKAYETLVGERGVKLSGGQRQRVAIARAMIKDAPILVLDEATSALDSESERLIQDALWKLMENKTAIVIAHRLSTIQKMDRILVLENGEIVEDGSHKELLQNDGIYAELWKHQSGGFIED